MVQICLKWCMSASSYSDHKDTFQYVVSQVSTAISVEGKRERDERTHYHSFKHSTCYIWNNYREEVDSCSAIVLSDTSILAIVYNILYDISGMRETQHFI